MAAGLAEDLRPGLESEDFVNRRFRLVLDHVLLNGVGVGERGLYQVVNHADRELLGVLLHTEAVVRQNLPHERLDDLGMCPLG